MPQMNKEFQGPADLTSMDRRDFMKALGLLSSVSFLANCSRKAEKIIPYLEEQEAFTGKTYEYYMTAMNHQGFAQGITVKSFQGRPIKIEGNPSHPTSLGATTPEAQAALFDLYHPDRLQDVRWMGKSKKLKELNSLLKEKIQEWGDGEDLSFLLPPDHSPAKIRMAQQIQTKFPKALIVFHAPWKREEFRSTSLEEIDVVVSFDEDLFWGRPDSLSLTKGFMRRRRKAMEANDPAKLNRLISFHSSPLLSGAKADQKFLLTPDEIWNQAIELKDALEGRRASESMKKMARELKQKKSAVFISRNLHPLAQDLEGRINGLISSPVTTLSFPFPGQTYEDLIQRLRSSQLKALVMVETDPYYWHPELEPFLDKIPFKLSFGMMETNSSRRAEAVVASQHFLESWGDLISSEGSLSLQQPLIEPIFHSLSPLSFLSLFLGEERTSYDIIHEAYHEDWDRLLQEGFLPQGLKPQKLTRSNSTAFLKLPIKKEYKLKLVPDFSLGYGSQDQNPLLQELPKAFFKTTWGNAYGMSAQDARDLRLENFDQIKISQGESEATGPVMILPHVAPGVLLGSLGYGKDDRGVDLYSFQNNAPVQIKKLNSRKTLAVAQENFSTENRVPILTTTLPAKPRESHPHPSLYPEHPLPHQNQGPQWGMTIDLSTCVGCEACVLACQVENNIPFVGEDQVKKGRLLHWIRIDTYHVGEETYFQPVPCMHCEKAPCEVVCPVNATVHGQGGLNEMIYNRCVGTRYCSNNCPYRVRRFNFKAYSVLKYPFTLGFNPEVSVRDRGVMEKCTYCIQRLKSDSPDHVKTACAQVCPSEAIVFGDLREASSPVSLSKKDPRHYHLLEEEGTLPRTSYLKVVRP